MPDVTTEKSAGASDHISYESLFSYVLIPEQWSEADKSIVERHVESCEQCKRQLDDIRKYKKYSGRPVRSVRRYWIFAAIAGVAALIYFAWPQWVQKAVVHQDNFIDSLKTLPKDTLTLAMATNVKDSGQAISKTNWSENFVEDANLEKLVHLPSKSDLETTVSSPPPGAIFTNHIVFSWQSADTASMHSITILNNRNQEVWTSQTQRHSLSFNGSLEPGLYYWKLIKQGRLLYIDKVLRRAPKE